jgi:hypothetical protein
MSMQGVVIGVTGNFDRQILSRAVSKAGGRVDAIIHKNLNYVSTPLADSLANAIVGKPALIACIYVYLLLSHV